MKDKGLWLIVVMVFIWPGVILAALMFLSDAPFRNQFDMITRFGFATTMSVLPVLVFLFHRLGVWLSKRRGSRVWRYLLPWIPLVLVVVFAVLNESELAREKPDGCDVSTYMRINGNYTKDKNHVYYNYKVIEGADPASFVVPKKKPGTFANICLAHDDKDYYYMSKPMHVADYDSFRVLGDMYSCDSLCVYYKSSIIDGADPATMRIIDGEYGMAQDRHCVYYHGKATDVKDFSRLKRHSRSDSHFIFYTDGSDVYTSSLQKMPEGTDSSTLRAVVDYHVWYADKNRAYYGSRVMQGADPQKIVVFPNYEIYESFNESHRLNRVYSHDGSHVYCRDSVVVGADIASFKCGYDYVDGVQFAFDNNRYYTGHPTPRTVRLQGESSLIDNKGELQ